MNIKLASLDRKNTELETVIKSIIEGLDLETEINMVFFSDLCSLIIANHYFSLISFLEVIKYSITTKFFHIVLDQDLTTTITILKAVQEFFKKTVICPLNLQ